jgi:hypothetical protein
MEGSVKSIPDKIDGAKVVCYSGIDFRHKNTGSSSQYMGNSPMGLVGGLAICQYEGKTDFYLFYCDSDWNAMNSIIHTTLEKAKEKAEHEYSGIGITWEKIKTG